MIENTNYVQFFLKLLHDNLNVVYYILNCTKRPPRGGSSQAHAAQAKVPDPLLPFSPQICNDEPVVITEEATQWDWTKETPDPSRVLVKWRRKAKLCVCLPLKEATRQASSKSVWWNQQTAKVLWPSPFAFMPLKCSTKWECNTSHILY
jgi:hypothetical protein